APSAPVAVSAAAEAPRASAPALDVLTEAAASRGDSGRRFDGGRAAAPVDSRVSSGRGGQQRGQQPQFIKNADGVWVGGRVAEQAIWINKMVAELSPKIDLSGVIDVMDDAYDEARVKLHSVEKAAADRKLAASSVHL